LLIYARTAEHISDFLTLQWGGFVARLYTLGSSGELVEAQEKPFLDETSDMEDFVKKNAKILGDLIIFSEQTISAGRDKRTDLLAINKDGDVLIIELKMILAGPDVLGQVLGYRNYWRQNLEAVKNLWNEFREKPEEFEPDFQNYDPRVLLVAPEFEKELLEIVSSERLPIECAEITRYEHEDRIFVVVDRMEPPVAKIGPVVGQREYGGIGTSLKGWQARSKWSWRGSSTTKLLLSPRRTNGKSHQGLTNGTLPSSTVTGTFSLSSSDTHGKSHCVVISLMMDQTRPKLAR
jgi:hypothetical protein